MPESRRVVVSGYYGYSNPGDEAILQVLTGDLRHRVPGVQIAVISGTPEQTADAHSVEAIRWSDPLAIGRAVHAADLVITGGGGIFHDYGGFPHDGLLTEGNWGLGFHVTAGLFAAVFRKPLMLYAVGVGPLFSAEARMYTRAICEAAQAITVRDAGSAALLESIGVPAERVRLTADPAFLLGPAAHSETSKPLTVCVRHWSHEVDPEQWISATGAALGRYLDADGGRTVRLLPFQRFPGEQEDDLAIARRLNAVVAHDRCQIDEGRYSPAEIAGRIAASRLVLGMRLHSLIFAWAAGVPFVALAYDGKVRELMSRAGRERYSLPMAALDPGRLFDLLEEAAAHPPPDPEPLRMLARRNGELAAGLLHEPAPLAPLGGEPLALLERALFSLLESNARLRHWLADQKINYEYQVAQLQAESARERSRAEAAEASLAELEARYAGWRRHAQELEDAAAAKRAHYERRLGAWHRYADELSDRLAMFRSQRAWRVMLAVRKAYTLLFRQGWSGRLRFLPWLLQLPFGGGSLETEQLAFPPRPEDREAPPGG